MFQSLVNLLPSGFREFVAHWWRGRFRYLAFVLVVSGIAAGIAWMLPPWYRASATLLPPPESSDSFGIMAGMIQQNALNQLGLLSTSTPSDVFAEILKSRTVREALIRKFDLQTRYKRKNLDAALKELDLHAKVGVNRSSIIEISVEDTSPRMAADMANEMVALLDQFNHESYVTKAKRTRIFLEQRLSESSEHMHAAESTLAVYERTNHVLTTTGDNSAVQGMAALMSQKMALEVRRAYIASYSRADSPELREIDSQTEAIDRQIVKVPALKQAGARLALDAEIQRRVFTLLNAQYEDARMQEARDTPTIAVLDYARPPLIRSRPRRTIIVLVTAFAAAALTMAWAALQRRTPGVAMRAVS